MIAKHTKLFLFFEIIIVLGYLLVMQFQGSTVWEYLINKKKLGNFGKSKFYRKNVQCSNFL